MSGAAQRSPQRFALVVGAMKSGTSSLFALLSQHPQIAASRVKETDFFARDADPTDGWSGYLSQWDWDPSEHEIALEASPSYAKSPWVSGVAERIASVEGAEFRFIYVMRDPLRRIESQVRHGLFEEWGDSLDAGVPPDAVDFSNYARQLDEYAKHFPRSAILAFTLEEFVADPVRGLQRCCQFLGVSEFDFADPHLVYNKGDFFEVSGGLRSLLRISFLRQAAVRLLPSSARHATRTAIGRLSTRSSRRGGLGRWRLSEDERAEIARQLAPDLARLETQFGVDVLRFWHEPVGHLRRDS